MECIPPGPSVHGISQARILERVAISFSRGSSQPRNRTWVSCIAGRLFTDWVMRGSPIIDLCGGNDFKPKDKQILSMRSSGVSKVFHLRCYNHAIWAWPLTFWYGSMVIPWHLLVSIRIMFENTAHWPLFDKKCIGHCLRTWSLCSLTAQHCTVLHAECDDPPLW